jgi:hypothetical protein
VPRFASLVVPANVARGAVPGAFSKLVGVQGRADELSKRIAGVLGRPDMRTWLGIPSERMLRLQGDRLASQ